MALDYLLRKRRFEIELLSGKIPNRKAQISYLGIAIKTHLPIESINRRLRSIKKFDQLIEMEKKFYQLIEMEKSFKK